MAEDNQDSNTTSTENLDLGGNTPKKDYFIEARLWGLFQLAGLFLFIFGFFTHNLPLSLLGGAILLLEQLIGIISRTIRLGPFFFFAFVGALIVTPFKIPWYIGVFWSTAVFSIIDIPSNFRKIFNPEWFEQKRIDGMKQMLNEYKNEE